MKLPVSLSNKTVFFLALVISFVLYGNTLSHQYALDDAIVITKNKFVKEGFSGISNLLTSDSFLGFFGEKKDLVAGGRYRPLSLITFAIEYQFFGETPWISHLINILIYALIGWLIFITLSRLLSSRFEGKSLFLLSAFSALLFMLHPIHTEVVANIKGRDELMSLMFSLMAFHFVLKFVDAQKKTDLYLACISLFLGLMAKENALAFAFIIPASLWFFRKPNKQAWWLSIICIFIPSIIFLIIRGQILGGGTSSLPDELMNNPFLGATTTQKYATILFTWFIYLKLLVFPHPLTYDYYPYHIHLVGFNHPAVLFMLISSIALVVLFFNGLKTKSIPAFSILGFAASFGMVSNLFFPVGTFMNERFVFMPSLFWSVGLVTLLYIWFDKKKSFPVKITVYALCVYTLVFYPVKTIARNRAWANDLTLFTTDVRTSANSAKSNCSAGGKLWEEGKTIKNNNLQNNYFSQSETYLRKAIAIYPNYGDAWLLLGNLLYDYKKDIEGSAQCYLEVLKRQPGNKDARQNIDIVVTQSTNYTWAREYYTSLLKIDSNQFKPNYRLGVIYGRYLGNLSQSLRYLEKAHQIDPNNVEAMKDLGTAYGMSGQPAKAAAVFEKALQKNPSDPQLYFNYGISLMQTGNKTKADSMFALANKYKGK